MNVSFYTSFNVKMTLNFNFALSVLFVFQIFTLGSFFLTIVVSRNFFLLCIAPDLGMQSCTDELCGETFHVGVFRMARFLFLLNVICE